MNPLEGIIELKWPGKDSELSFSDEKWKLISCDNKVSKHALLFQSKIGEGNNAVGYSIKGDILSTLHSLYSFVPSSIQLIYFDAPRLSVFQNLSEPGYSTATWLSLVRQTAMKSIQCLAAKGFFALHVDEEMAHLGRMVLEEIFGKSRYVGTFAWQKQYAPQNDNFVPTDILDYIIVFSKSPVAELPRIGLLVSPKKLKDDGDFRGCYTDGHKGARSGSEASKFKINTSPYHWEIIDSHLPKGRYYFDKILGSLWFEKVESTGHYYIKVKATDKNGNIAERKIDFNIRERESINDSYQVPDRIWWLLKNDNDIVREGELRISDLPIEQLTGIKGQEFSLVLKAEGGVPFTMKSDSPGSGRYWEFSSRTLIEGIARAKASFGSKGASLPSIKKYFNRNDAKKIQAVTNFLPWYDFGHTQDATQHSRALKAKQITDGTINMTAKPQKLLSHLISLLAPGKHDLVLAMGDSNCVFSSVAIKMQRPFINLIGASAGQLSTWEKTGSKRLEYVLKGLDTDDIDGNKIFEYRGSDTSCIDVLYLSKSFFLFNEKNNEIEPFFDPEEDPEAFYAGLVGAYKQMSNQNAYRGMDNRIVVIVPEEESLDSVLLDSYRQKYKSDKLFVVYESIIESIQHDNNVVLKRAPFEII